ASLIWLDESWSLRLLLSSAVPGTSPVASPGRLGRTLATSVQLRVPLLAALASLIWLDESWSLRLLLSSLGILGA
ncbi:hypothetical protein LFM01_01135, partial [Aeromonas piscicola]|nr:hypothetical protein [Aeromonas piscicola]